jgi:3'-phosphoadenosine 5'-phosphosulfate (PAPS) 3'-phosphatase
MNEAIKACMPENISRVAGSGNKFIHLLDNKTDYYLNLVPGFKYWDMCASEALI